MKTEDFKTATYILERQKAIYAIKHDIERAQNELYEDGKAIPGTGAAFQQLNVAINKCHRELERLTNEFKSI